MTGINTHWFLEGIICFPRHLPTSLIANVTIQPIGAFSDSKGQRAGHDTRYVFDPEFSHCIISLTIMAVILASFLSFKGIHH